MCIAMAGDFNPDEAIKIIDKYFGSWVPGNVPEFHKTKEDPITSPIIRLVNGQDPESLTMAFRIEEGNGSRDALLAQAMEYVLNIRLEEHVLRRMIVKACMTFSGEIFNTSILVTMLNAQQGKFVYYDNYKDSISLLDNPFTGDSAYMLLNVNSGLPPVVVSDEVSRKNEAIKDLVTSLRKRPGIFPFSNVTESSLRDRIQDLDEEEKRICLYILEEYRAAQLASFSDSVLAKAMARTEKALRNKLELSFPEMDWLIKRSSGESACQGVSVALNGGNGNVALVIKKDAVDSYRAKLEEYEHIFGFKVKTGEFLPCAAAEVFRK